MCPYFVLCVCCFATTQINYAWGNVLSNKWTQSTLLYNSTSFNWHLPYGIIGLLCFEIIRSELITNVLCNKVNRGHHSPQSHEMFCKTHQQKLKCFNEFSSLINLTQRPCNGWHRLLMCQTTSTRQFCKSSDWMLLCISTFLPWLFLCAVAYLWQIFMTYFWLLYYSSMNCNSKVTNDTCTSIL